MPFVDGEQVLLGLRENPLLAAIPVIPDLRQSRRSNGSQASEDWRLRRDAKADSNSNGWFCFLMKSAVVTKKTNPSAAGPLLV